MSDEVEFIELPDRGYVYVDTPQGLDDAVDALRGSTVVGIDTESDSFFSFCSARNANHWPSGENRGCAAPSVPGIGVASGDAISRRWSCCVPSRSAT